MRKKEEKKKRKIPYNYGGVVFLSQKLCLLIITEHSITTPLCIVIDLPFSEQCSKQFMWTHIVFKTLGKENKERNMKLVNP